MAEKQLDEDALAAQKKADQFACVAVAFVANEHVHVVGKVKAAAKQAAKRAGESFAGVEEDCPQKKKPRAKAKATTGAASAKPKANSKGKKDLKKGEEEQNLEGGEAGQGEDQEEGEPGAGSRANARAARVARLAAITWDEAMG